jgi:hypothetical protein
MEKNLSTLKGLREIDALSVRMLKRNILFFCFITVLGLIYIANAHYAENKIRRIASLKSELKELNWEHMSLKANLVQRSAYSEVQKNLEESGLGLRGQSPVLVVLDKK